jgi:uncharacterized NAD(P)/FAD-binding protein YdhS
MRFTMDGHGVGLLTLALLSAATAAFPWLAKADPAVAISLSLLALGFPAAALRAAAPCRENQRRKPSNEPRTGRHVVIIGSGFTGTLLAIQLLRAGERKVTLVERRRVFARGLAYSADGGQLLNVRAAKMSAFPDEERHFSGWLERHRLGTSTDFAPRRVYGQYLASLLAQSRAAAGDRLALVRGEAVDIETRASGPQVILSDGRRIAADAAVLAIGNLPPATPAALAGIARASDRYVPDPWSSDFAASLGPGDTVLLLGTGLTMVDVALQLQDSGFEGKTIALSRRGLLPRAHGEAGSHPAADGSMAGAPLSQMVRRLRTRSREIGWRAAVDALRSTTQDIWGSASHEERARFLRHLRPWWDVHRHRVAPALAQRIEDLQREGRLEVIAAKLDRATLAPGGLSLSVRPRGSAESRSLSVARIINCTGPGDPCRSVDPLLGALLARGAVRADRLGLGIEIAGNHEVIGADGRPTPAIFAIGPVARGLLWETTAVPDLRCEAAKLAHHIVAGVHSQGPSC